ncbi:hypothetical protein STEG23_013747 [Scotinomys teguina]
MEVVAAAPRCQLLLIVLMAVMLLPGMKGSPLLVQRTVTRTIVLQETIGKEEHGEEVIHQCQDILAEEAGVRSDLKDIPLPHSDVIWYTDGSSFLYEGNRWAGVAVVDKEKVIWSARLPEDTSARKAELIALTKALEEARDERATIYTDSRYAFATAHVHGAIYRERGLLTSTGKEIKNKQEILALLAAVMLPQELAIVHCPGENGGRMKKLEQRL